MDNQARNSQTDLEALVLACRELKDVCNRPSAARTRAQAWRMLDRALAKYSWVQAHGK